MTGRLVGKVAIITGETINVDGGVAAKPQRGRGEHTDPGFQYVLGPETKGKPPTLRPSAA